MVSTGRWRLSAGAASKRNSDWTHQSTGNRQHWLMRILLQQVGNPCPCSKHQAFFATDQPTIQLANPASQSYGSDDVTQPPPWFGQPLPWTRQHHSFFGTDQPACPM